MQSVISCFLKKDKKKKENEEKITTEKRRYSHDERASNVGPVAIPLNVTISKNLFFKLVHTLFRRNLPIPESGRAIHPLIQYLVISCMLLLQHDIFLQLSLVAGTHLSKRLNAIIFPRTHLSEGGIS